MMDNDIGSITDGGVCPIYGCRAEWDLAQAQISQGNLGVHFRIHEDNFQMQTGGGWVDVPGCPAPHSRKLGFCRFTDCGPGTVGSAIVLLGAGFKVDTLVTVTAGQCYSTKPGNFISSISGELDTLNRDSHS